MQITSLSNTGIQKQFGQLRTPKTDHLNKISPDRIKAEKVELQPETENNRLSQDDLNFLIEKNINDSSKFLHDGLVKIFSNGEALLAGRSSQEYEKHITDLSEAIKGQDYKRAEKLIDKFFGGATDKITNRIKSLARSAEDKFWTGMSDSLGYLKKWTAEYDLEVDGQKFKNISMTEIAELAMARVKNEVDPFSEQDFSGIVSSVRNRAVAHAKDKLSNAGQNRYSEDAISITASAAEFSKNLVFNTDDINIKEDETELADIFSLKEGEGITEEQIERLKHRNNRKADTFSGYMRERSDRFLEEFAELSNKAVRVKDGESTTASPEEQTAGETVISSSLLATSQQAQSRLSIADFEELQDIGMLEEQSEKDCKKQENYSGSFKQESITSFEAYA